MDLCLEA